MKILVADDERDICEALSRILARNGHGCVAVYDGEAALAAWREGLAPALIVCGAQGKDEPMPEAVAMRDWLAAQGVPHTCLHFLDGWQVCLPGPGPACRMDAIEHFGSYGAGEDRLEAARRELKEETGLEASEWQHLTDFISTPGFCDEKISIYLARGLSQGESRPDDDEFLYLCRLPLAEAVEKVMKGEIQDGKTVAALLMAARVLGI